MKPHAYYVRFDRMLKSCPLDLILKHCPPNKICSYRVRRQKKKSTFSHVFRQMKRTIHCMASRRLRSSSQ